MMGIVRVTQSGGSPGRRLQAALNVPSSNFAQAMLARGLIVATRAKQNLSNNPQRVDTGRLRNSIRAQLETRTGTLRVVIGSNVAYALYVHEGTGVYGPKGAPIRPKTKKALSWKAGGVRITRKSSRGMQPNKFLTNALRG